jgi:hypothetical protein
VHPGGGRGRKLTLAPLCCQFHERFQLDYNGTGMHGSSAWPCDDIYLAHLQYCLYAKGGAPPTGWSYTTQSSHPDCQEPEAKPHR